MSSLKQAILGIVGDKVASPARLTSVRALSDHFRLIELESESLRQATWNPGDKVQINTGDWNLRTYTPLSLDVRAGRISILAYLHGNGPGSGWAAAAWSGDSCHVRGPRSSLSFSDSKTPVVFFGDETSFAVASNLRGHLESGIESSFVMEVSAPREARAVLDELGLHDVMLVERRGDASHLVEIARHIARAMTELQTGDIILTGSAPSIQQIRTSLKAEGVSLARCKAKAYWAPGKSGLD